MPLASEMAALVAAQAADPAFLRAGTAPVSVEEARAQHEQDAARFSPIVDRDVVATVDELAIPTGSATLQARRYRPSGAPTATLIWFHGGGWVTGSLDTGDVVARALCARAQVTVLSVAYRLAPEAAWPQPYHDCLAATEWVLDHAADLELDGPTLVGGDSAGGNLAGAVALQLGRDRLAGQVLLYPVVVLDAPAAAFPSRTENATGYYVTWDDIEWAIAKYAPNVADRSNPRASLQRASELATAPPAVVVAVEYDTLRDEDISYAEALQAAGTPAQLLRFDGLVHGCFDMIGISSTANHAMDSTATSVRDLIGSSALA